MDLLRIKQRDDFPENFNVIVEIPKGSKTKYEFDRDYGTIKLDRILFGPFAFPTNYGFAPRTWCDDNDPVDVILISSEPIHPFILVEARPIGVLKMRDEKGLDWKVLAVPLKDPQWNLIRDYQEIPMPLIKEIELFFRRYKELETGKFVEIEGWGDNGEAKDLLKRTHEEFIKRFGDEDV